MFSCEFFPPKTDDGVERLRETRLALRAMQPAFFSVTFGAGGSTRERTFETVREIQRDDPIEVAPHISCIGSTKAQLREIIKDYRDLGIRRLVALRGDLPSGTGDPGDFRFAWELVEFIRAETGDHFHIEVAAYPEFHPQARSPDADIDNFARKIRAGANSGITQYFFNPDAYFRLVDALADRGVEVPVVPGIMPITNHTQLARFSDACGAEIPRWIRRPLEAFGDDIDSIRAFGVDVVTQLCDRLLAQGAPGLHFYTMNRASATLAIWNRIKH
ncbi:MAG: methylenetetrahydrofolate reductase [NAD(P)H] [Chromatiales bacterium]|nr:methylenetetrahydrofolate reductase [NAD(P)H] [Chromatiales bacterium]